MAVSLTQRMMRLTLPPAMRALSRYAPGFSSGVVTVTRSSTCPGRGSRARSQEATRPILADGLPPASRRLDVLAAVLEDLGQGVPGLLAGRALAPPGHPSIDRDPVELVGQLEALDARGQPGDGLVLAQRV